MIRCRSRISLRDRAECDLIPGWAFQVSGIVPEAKCRPGGRHFVYFPGGGRV